MLYGSEQQLPARVRAAGTDRGSHDDRAGSAYTRRHKCSAIGVPRPPRDRSSGPLHAARCGSSPTSHEMPFPKQSGSRY